MLPRTAYWSIQWTLEIMEAGKWSWIFYFILLLYIFFLKCHLLQSLNPIRKFVNIASDKKSQKSKPTCKL